MPTSTQVTLDNLKLAILRTELANRRTMLAYFKASVGLLVSAMGFLKLFAQGSVFEVIGLGLIPLAFAVLVWGVVDYARSRKTIAQEKRIAASADGEVS